MNLSHVSATGWESSTKLALVALRRLLVVGAFALAGAWTHAAPTYHLTDLGSLGGAYTFATDINDSGQVVGYGQNGEADERGFIWQDGVIEEIGTIRGGRESRAYAVNNIGTVVGWSTTSGRGPHAFTWTSQKGVRELPLGSERISYANAINGQGVIAGSYMVDDLAQRAFAIVNGQFTDLGTLGGDYSEANDVNEHGAIAGTAADADGNARGFVWTEEAGLRALSTLGGSFSSGQAINWHGMVAGIAETTNGYHAVIWDANGNIIDLDAANGTESSQALDLNDSGRVVGQTFVEAGARAVMWTPEGKFIDLNLAVDESIDGWVLEGAVAINNHGQIVGYGTVNGEIHSYLLTPVPEPGSVFALSAGLAGLLYRRRKRRSHP